MVGVVEGRLPLRKLLGRLVHLDTISIDFPKEADNLRLQGDLEAAAWLCARGLERFPGYASGHVVMGEILREQGRSDLAERQWQEALRCHPEHPRAHLYMAQLHLGRGDLGRAMSALELSLLYAPTSSEANALLDRARASEQVRKAEGHSAAGLRQARLEAMWWTARRCAPSAVIVEEGGTVVCGQLYPRQEKAGAATLAATLMLESRLLMARVGAGMPQAAHIVGTDGILHCYELDGATLIAAMDDGGAGGAELERIVAALREGAVQRGEPK